MKRYVSILLLIFLTSVPSLLFIANHQIQEEEKMATYHPGHQRSLSQNLMLPARFIAEPEAR
ncbi:hypothetical protein [Niabella drilacis]|uniref:Uncharacterized protein n=1 Tax=Niabella drilacis (strain DSM 25811 / CCM 8410 / CCUG 62505 / LMG 26954 / E90) TaxID=1285928 RepID=A0A1G6YDT9_NIADE|nr:hypothetical protein [Niabella drilacis]SDD88634.1 hypothetical protein SAMN04487894_11586 [Niabella drilacis]